MKINIKDKGKLAIIILLIILIIAVIVAAVVIANSKKEENKEGATATNSVLVNEIKDTKKADNSKTNTVTNPTATPTKTTTPTPTTAPANTNSDTQTSSNNTTNNSLDKANIYVGTANNFKTYEVSISKELDVTDQAEALIKEIGFKMGYQIMIIDITSGKGGMSVNFDKDSAPFDVTNTYRGNGEEEYKVSGQENVARTIFDSVKETLQKNYGSTMDVYLLKNDSDIEINSIKIKSTEPYKGI